MADRAKVIERLERQLTDSICTKCSFYNGRCIGKLYADALKLLKEQPEIVRCKDCKNWIPGTINDDDNFNPPRCKRNAGVWLHDEYCSCAERRVKDE